MENLYTIGDRVKWTREKRDLDRKDLAILAGVPYPTLAGLENNDQKSSTELPSIAKALRSRIEWLQKGELPWEADPGADPDWKDVLGYAQEVGLGKSVEGAEYEEAHKLKFRVSSLKRKNLKIGDLRVVYGAGDSMLPRIHAGDAILFDASDTRERNGNLYVIALPGTKNKELQVKRAMILDDVTYFTADNPQGDHEWRAPRKKDAKKSPIEILGRVRWIGSWED